MNSSSLIKKGPWGAGAIAFLAFLVMVITLWVHTRPTWEETASPQEKENVADRAKRLLQLQKGDLIVIPNANGKKEILMVSWVDQRNGGRIYIARRGSESSPPVYSLSRQQIETIPYGHSQWASYQLEWIKRNF